MWTDADTMKCFSKTCGCWLLLLPTVKTAVGVANFQLEIVSVTRLLLVTEMHKADEVSEVRLVVEIDDELDEVSQVDSDELISDDEMDEDCEVHQADER